MEQRIAFVTCDAVPEVHADDRLVADALQPHGFQVTPAVWNDASVDWRGFASVVIRATWDYHLDADRYAAWLRACGKDGVNLWNPPAMVLSNIDKRYLTRLADAGVPAVPIAYLEPGDKRSLRALLERRGWPHAVVKPAVSASAEGTWRTSLTTAVDDQRLFDQEVMRRAMLVQPFVEEIVSAGEWSLVFFEGEYSHAVLKRPASGDFRVQEELGGRFESRAPSPAIVEGARRVLAHTPAPPLYARVDGVERAGTFVLMELEINEPFLYIGSAAGAAKRFADAIARTCRSGRPRVP